MPPARFWPSNTVGAKPISASSCAQERPAGPAPMTATLRPPPSRPLLRARTGADGAGRACADDRDPAAPAQPLAVRVAQLGIDAPDVEGVRLNPVALADEPLQGPDGY